MAQDAKSAVPTRVALIGGALGIAIVIYALFQGGNEAVVPETTDAVASVRPAQVAEPEKLAEPQQADAAAPEAVPEASTPEASANAVESVPAEQDPGGAETETAEAGDAAEALPVAGVEPAAPAEAQGSEAAQGTPAAQAPGTGSEAAALPDPAAPATTVNAQNDSGDSGDSAPAGDADPADAAPAAPEQTAADAGNRQGSDAAPGDEAAQGDEAVADAGAVLTEADAANNDAGDAAEAPLAPIASDETVVATGQGDGAPDTAGAVPGADATGPAAVANGADDGQAAAEPPVATAAAPVIDPPEMPSDDGSATVAALTPDRPLTGDAATVGQAQAPSAAPATDGQSNVQPLAVVLAPRTTPEGVGEAPRFDVVRIDGEGAAVVAGRAAPNATVEVMQNGQVVATATASSRGEFVALFTTDVQAQAQSLELASRSEEGAPQVFSESSVIVLGRTQAEIRTDGDATPADLAPAIISATPQDVAVLQPVVGLADLDNISLDSISYDSEGEVVLAGRGRTGNVARAYVNGAARVDGAISENGGWRIRLAGLSAGRYMLRIDEVNPDGKVVSRVESPFQRVYPSAENLAALSDERQVVIQRGDNLWNIARVRYGSGFQYTVIYDANVDQIRDPDLIYPGQIFDMPEAGGQAN